MEKGAIGGGVEGIEWLWGAASAAQLGWGVRSYTKGYAGDSRLMPIKAFAVASLFVGSAASASVVLLRANGIHKVLLLSVFVAVVVIPFSVLQFVVCEL